MEKRLPSQVFIYREESEEKIFRQETGKIVRRKFNNSTQYFPQHISVIIIIVIMRFARFAAFLSV